MTSVTLHTPPRFLNVIREQLRAVGFALRMEGVFFVGFLVLLTVFAVGAALHTARSASPQITGPVASGIMLLAIPLGFVGLLVPFGLAGMLVPFGVWRSEEPSRRSYHWTMPVARGPHTLVKTVAGWLWLMLALAVYLVYMVGLLAVVTRIVGGGGGGETAALSLQVILVPFTATTIIYLLTSAAVVGSDHPWRWLGGVFVSYVVVLGCFAALGLRDAVDVLQRLVTGSYGLSTALFGGLGSHTAHGRTMTFSMHMPGEPGATPWGGAVLLWIALGCVGVVVATYYRRDG